VFRKFYAKNFAKEAHIKEEDEMEEMFSDFRKAVGSNKDAFISKGFENLEEIVESFSLSKKKTRKD